MLEVLALLVEVTDGIISAVLACIFTWELEAIAGVISDRDCVMHEIYVFGGPLLVVLDEAVVEVTHWHGISRVLVVA